jgi:hypothetical protein
MHARLRLQASHAKPRSTRNSVSIAKAETLPCVQTVGNMRGEYVSQGKTSCGWVPKSEAVELIHGWERSGLLCLSPSKRPACFHLGSMQKKGRVGVSFGLVYQGAQPESGAWSNQAGQCVLSAIQSNPVAYPSSPSGTMTSSLSTSPQPGHDSCMMRKVPITES